MASDVQIVNVTAQAALLLACGVQPHEFTQALDETGLRYSPIPETFSGIAVCVQKLKEWVAEQERATLKALTA